MKFYHALQTALRALRRNVTRSALTALGIIIGVAAVITMMEIGSGSSQAIQKTIASMGANNLVVMPGTAASSGISFGGGSALTLTPDDATAILQRSPSTKDVAPIVRARTQVIYRSKNWVPLYIYGTTPSFINVRDWTRLDAGEMFTERDVRNSNKVCVIGQTLRRELFGNENPIGKELRIQNVTFKVVGILAPKGANMMGMDQDDIVIAPWTTIKYRIAGATGQTPTQPTQSSSSSGEQQTLSNLYPNTAINYYPAQSLTQSANTPNPVRFTNIDQILAVAHTGPEIKSAIDEITTLLRERHRIRPGEPDDFSIRDLSEVTQSLSTTSKLMTRLLLSVALISLIVGGVGIMNIMLVSVTERTREIGLRMAVGAKAKDILLQFLVEAIVLCLAGGIIGVVFGRSCSLLIAAILHWPTKASISAIIAAFGVSAGVGIIFGYYPAWKASKLDPIEALRYE